MTRKQAEVLRSLARGRYVSGGEVRVVRTLEAMGFAKLEDDGRVGGNSRERWWATATLAGNRSLEVRS